MTIEKIEHFLIKKIKTDCLIHITFKKRNTFSGFFIITPDFNELKLKNFWRLVSQANYEQWKTSKDFNLCRMFNGADIKKLMIV